MENVLIGYRFSPTGVELVNHYLKNKNLGNTWLVDEAISEIKILSYEPKFLPSLAKIQSDDLNWYFFSRIEYANAKKNAMKRSTGSGFWKPTGRDRIIRDKDGVEIGLKKTLVYHEGKAINGVRTDWVMHEYHITCLPHDQRTYVICQVMYKDEDGDIPSGGNYSSEPSQSLVSDSNTIRVTSIPPVFQVEQQPDQANYYGFSENDLRTPLNEQADLSECDGFDPNTFFSDDNNNHVQLQTPYLPQDDGEFMCGLLRAIAQHLLSDQDSIMQEEYNDYMLMNTVTAETITTASEVNPVSDYSSDSDSDAESISATSYQGTSSPGDGVGSSNRHSQTGLNEIISLSKDLQTSDEPSISRKTREYQLTRRTLPSKQEVKQGAPRAIDVSIMKTEKKGWFITEEAMERNRKSPWYIYVMRMIIGFILLLALTGMIISA